jgi:hypothetical protein
MTGGSGWVRWALRLATIATLLFIYVPLAVVVVYAFNASNIQTWPIPGISLRWFERAVADGSIRVAFLNSIIAACGATAIALVLGSMAAFAVQRYRFFGRETVSFLVISGSHRALGGARLPRAAHQLGGGGGQPLSRPCGGFAMIAPPRMLCANPAIRVAGHEGVVPAR